MICYKDMTFCAFYEYCKNGKACKRALTPEVREAAQRWWGNEKEEAPICIYTDQPHCYEKIKEDKC